MKFKYKSLFLLVMVFAITGIFSSCSEEEPGKPMIKYVRVTSPESSDSLLIGAFQGNVIAIVGENLQNTKQIWFNDLRSSLNPNYVTSTSIIVTTPADVPKKIENTMKIVFSNGDTLVHFFIIAINAPRVTRFKSEHVATGNILNIYGDFFYEPLTVKFTGGVQGKIVSINKEATAIEVEVPEGIEPGPVQVTSNFGQGKSVQWFRDNRGVFYDDPFPGWWHPISNGPTPEPISGSYLRLTQKMDPWKWQEFAGGPANTTGGMTKNIPDDAFANPANYFLKFEVNTIKPYNGSVIKIGIGDDSADRAYKWEPPLDTKGQWETISISMDVVLKTQLPVKTADGYYFRAMFHGGTALDCDMAFDNFRVVPKK